MVSKNIKIGKTRTVIFKSALTMNKTIQIYQNIDAIETITLIVTKLYFMIILS